MFQYQAADMNHVDKRLYQFHQIDHPLVSRQAMLVQFAIFVMARWQVVALLGIVLIELLAEFVDLGLQVDSTYLFDCLVDFVLAMLVLICLDQSVRIVVPLLQLVRLNHPMLDRQTFEKNLIHPMLEQIQFVAVQAQPFENRVLLVENQFELVESLSFLAMMQVLVEHLVELQTLVALDSELDQSQHF